VSVRLNVWAWVGMCVYLYACIRARLLFVCLHPHACTAKSENARSCVCLHAHACMHAHACLYMCTMHSYYSVVTGFSFPLLFIPDAEIKLPEYQMPSMPKMDTWQQPTMGGFGKLPSFTPPWSTPDPAPAGAAKEDKETQ